VGENFLRAQTQNFRRQRDLVVERREQCRELFDHMMSSDIVQVPIRLAAEPPPVNSEVWTCREADNVGVYQDSRLIGWASLSSAEDIGNDGRNTGRIESVTDGIAMIVFDVGGEDEPS
jgi:hypothetical protein